MASNLVSKDVNMPLCVYQRASVCMCVPAGFCVHKPAVGRCFPWFLLWFNSVYLGKLSGSSKEPLMKVMHQLQRINEKSYAFFPLSDSPHFRFQKIRKEHLGMKDEALCSHTKTLFSRKAAKQHMLFSISLQKKRFACNVTLNCFLIFFPMSPF